MIDRDGEQDVVFFVKVAAQVAVEGFQTRTLRGG